MGQKFFNAKRIEQSAGLQQFAQTSLGKVILLIIFATGLFALNQLWLIPDWPLIVVFLTVISFFPSKRKLIILLATFSLLKNNAQFNWHLLQQATLVHSGSGHIFLIISVLFFALLFIFLTKYYQCKHAVLYWGITFFLLLAFVSYLPASFPIRIYFLGFMAVLANYFWFVAYSLRGAKQRAMADLAYDIRYYIPFWGSTFTPLPKGADYLNKIEAKHPQQLAVSQIKAIKLLYWALLVAIVYGLVLQVQKIAHIVPLTLAFKDYQAGIRYAPSQAWGCLFVQFLLNLLNLTIWGHLVIAVARMAGFQALRNTYKPLLATNIAEFWNRYYFYFKELLVEFFFYPNYFRFFKNSPKLRILFATFMAAGFGNAVYHYFYYLQYPLQLGIWGALCAMQAYLFYCLLLALAIGCSQVFHKRNKLSWSRKLLAPIWVNGFYLLMTIFSAPYATNSIMINFAFLKSLFL